ICISLREYTLF
ncbi:unnamed protein product, partial [Allacma fusca]